MSRRTISPYDRARGARLRQVREAFNETQPEFAKRLNKEAKAHGYPERYYDVVVSRIENGSMTFEDAMIWMGLDPHERSFEWFMRGGAEHRMGLMPAKRRRG